MRIWLILAVSFLSLALTSCKKAVIPTTPAAEAPDEAEAIKKIEQLGGKVNPDAKKSGTPVVAVVITGSKVTDEGLKVLKNLKQLKSLYLGGTRITDEGLKELKELKQLKDLSLHHTQVTDVGLKELKDLKQLEELDLSKTNVTDAGVADFQKALPNCKIDR